MPRPRKTVSTPTDAQSWDHPAGQRGQIAVKEIDPRGNELLVVKKLEERR